MADVFIKIYCRENPDDGQLGKAEILEALIDRLETFFAYDEEEVCEMIELWHEQIVRGEYIRDN